MLEKCKVELMVGMTANIITLPLTCAHYTFVNLLGKKISDIVLYINIYIVGKEKMANIQQRNYYSKNVVIYTIEADKSMMTFL